MSDDSEQAPARPVPPETAFRLDLELQRKRAKDDQRATTVVRGVPA